MPYSWETHWIGTNLPPCILIYAWKYTRRVEQVFHNKICWKAAFSIGTLRCNYEPVPALSSQFHYISPFMNLFNGPLIRGLLSLMISGSTTSLPKCSHLLDIHNQTFFNPLSSYWFTLNFPCICVFIIGKHNCSPPVPATCFSLLISSLTILWQLFHFFPL